MEFSEYLNTRLPNSAYQGCLWYFIREGKYLASYLQMCPPKVIYVLSIKKSRISFLILFCWFRMSFDFVKWLIPSLNNIFLSMFIVLFWQTTKGLFFEDCYFLWKEKILRIISQIKTDNIVTKNKNDEKIFNKYKILHSNQHTYNIKPILNQRCTLVLNSRMVNTFWNKCDIHCVPKK